MSREHKKYVREQKADDDKQQTRFSSEAKAQLPTTQKTDITITIGVTEQVMCPFCLYADKLQKFFISTKKGIHKGIGQCPDCKNKMRLNTLVAEWTPEDYAKWCFEYSTSGFWEKVSWTKWTERLRKIGWSYLFWNKYKELKADYVKTESYDEYILRKQKEEYEGMAEEE